MDWRVRSIVQILILGCLSAIIECGTAEQRVVCYYTNWSVYRPGTAKFSPQNINPYLCTHLIYAFGGFTKDNTLKPFDKYQDIEKGGYAKFTGLKTYNKNLKTMLAIGGWNEGSSRFSPMVADPERRKEFVRNSVKFLRQNHFDGLDLDWEYPAFRDGGKPRDRDNYASLVQELREAYDRESSKTGRPRLLLSMAVPAGIEYINKGYDIPKLDKYLDFINLLSYDYHSSYEPAVNHHSPLYPLEEDNEYNFDTELTVDFTIKHLLKSGASADKIVLGIPTYGRSYTLFNEEATDIGSPADGPGEEGDATREKGYLAYYEICEGLIDSDEWEVVSPNSNAMGPYAYKGNQWVGYDDEAIVRRKAEYVSENGLGGIMFWSIDNDDFRGKCHDRPYPLIEAAKEAMLAGTEKTEGSEKSTRPTKTRQQTNSNFIGRKLGTGSRRTTETSVARQDSSRKRPNSLRNKNRSNTRDNSEEEDTEVQVNGRNRGQFSSDSEEDDEINENSKIGLNVVRSIAEGSDDNEDEVRSRPQSGNRPRNNQANRRRSGNNRRRSTTARSVIEPVAAQARYNKVTTPAPPTTPDPGTDFKCEDEGFFSHPRDCKKYFWCLDSGPGGLGIVAHHFTCPAGLVFNKGADSCDYPRNVVCPKANPDEPPATRAPIIAATSRTTRIQSTTRRSASTTTKSSEDEEDYEYYDDEDEEDDTPATTTTAKTLLYKSISRNRPITSTSTSTTTSSPTTTKKPRSVTSRTYQSIPSRSRETAAVLSSIEEVEEEDPRVIQELIELIKKAGGIEELEKQLHLQGRGSESTAKSGTAKDKSDVTPASITRSLYERVLNRKANSGTTLFPRTTVTPTITTTIELAERLDPQASVSQRSQSSFRNGPGGAQFEGLDDLPEVKSLRREKPQYVTINRQRSSTQAPDEGSEEIENDNTNGASSEEKLVDDPTETTSPSSQRETSGYVDIRRTRTSTARSDDLEDEEDDLDSYKPHRRPDASETETEDEDVPSRRNRFPFQEGATASTTSRYVTIQRGRSTTQASEEASLEEEEEAQITETTTKSANAPADITTTVSRPETTTVDEPEVLIPSTTESPIFVSTDLPDTQNVDSSTLSTATINLVEDTTTATTLPVVPNTERQETTSEESVTRRLATVSQPRPFGFQRRTRPTTTSSTITTSPETTTSSVNTETGRVKVPSETVRLPTLKEIIGHKTNVIPHDYTTTIPITLSIKNLNDDDNDINPTEHNKYIGQTFTPDITTEEVTSTQATTLETTGNTNNHSNRVEDNSIFNLGRSTATESPRSPSTLPIKILKQDDTRTRRRRIKLVNIPVRILESDKPITDVILEVPEHKLNSVLRHLLRVEIIHPHNEPSSYGKQSEDENSSQRTSEEEPNEILSKDANTNSAFYESQFTSTTPAVNTVRGNRLFTPRHVKSGYRGFYVTKRIESNTLYASVTPPTTLQSTTEFDNELSTTTEQLSTDDTPTTPTTSGITTTTSDYNVWEESASEETWPSIISTSLENFNSILAINEDVVTSTVTADYTASTEFLSNSETLNDVESTTEAAFTESEEKLNTSQFAEKSESFSTEESSSTDSEIFEPNLSTTTSSALSIVSTTSEGLDDYHTAFNTVTPADDQESTILDQNTESVTESSTLSSETTKLSTGLNLNNEASDVPDSQKTTASDFEGTSESTQSFGTETSTINSEPTRLSTDSYFNDETSDISDSQTTASDFEGSGESIQSFSTETSTINSESTRLNTEFYFNGETSDISDSPTTTASDSEGSRESTQSFTTETSTIGLETTRLSTGLYFNVETSDISDSRTTTAYDFEGTNESTQTFTTETSTISSESTAVTYDAERGLSNEVNPSTETISTDTTTDFGRLTISDFRSTTDQSIDNYSVLQTEATDSTPATVTSSVSNPDSQTTTFSSLNTETTLGSETSSPSTDSTISDSSTTLLPYTTIADNTETYSSTTDEAGSTTSRIESTTGSESTVTISTLATQHSEVSATQTASTLITSLSESTMFPSTSEKKEEPVNEVESAEQGTLQSPTQAPKTFTVSTEPTDLEFPRQGFYRSPTAVPGQKTERKRIVRKRIYGVRKPHVGVVNESETAPNIAVVNTSSKPRPRFIRRRIINHSTGKIVDEILKGNSTVLKNGNTTIYSNPDVVEKKVNNDRQGSQFKKILKHQTNYRRRPIAADNQTNSSIEANISSQNNNSASNNDHVQSSNVSSTNRPNQRRRIVVQRFRYRNSAVNKSTTTLSPSPRTSESQNTENTVEDKFLRQRGDKRKTSNGQDYRDVTIDNLTSGSESHESQEELPPRRDNNSEALQRKSEDKQADEINLFKIRQSNTRKPGSPIRRSRPGASTSVPENEITTTVSPSTKTPNNIAIRRRFRPGQRSTTPPSNARAQSDGETLESGTEDVSESLDRSGNAQEEVTVRSEDSLSSLAPPVPVTGRRPGFRTSVRRRIITTEVPPVTVSTTPRPTIVRQRQRPNPFDKVVETVPARPNRPAIIDYDYYEDSEERIVGKPKLSGKISFTAGGSIRCLDQGNFPHPTSCKKFITCARMVNGQVIGTEYTCPKRLSFDPIGGICNWSAGLGCKD